MNKKLDRIIDKKSGLKWSDLQERAVNGAIHDRDNPCFIFSMTNADLLTRILTGEIDIKAIAAHELEARR